MVVEVEVEAVVVEAVVVVEVYHTSLEHVEMAFSKLEKHVILEMEMVQILSVHHLANSMYSPIQEPIRSMLSG